MHAISAAHIPQLIKKIQPNSFLWVRIREMGEEINKPWCYSDCREAIKHWDKEDRAHRAERATTVKNSNVCLHASVRRPCVLMAF